MNPLEELQQMLMVAEKGGQISPLPTRVYESDIEGLDPRLHAYQRQAVAHLRSNPRAALFLDMGLGKTASTLQALTPEHLPALVIAPKRVVEEVWPVEVPKWRPDLSVRVASFSRAKRLAALDSYADIVAISRDNIRDVMPGKFRTIVIDEMSSFKNRTSNRWKIAKALTSYSAYVWGLTGTPAPNGYIDLWAQFFLLDGGKRLGKTLTSYRTRYFNPGNILRTTGVVTNWEIKAGAKEAIERQIADIVLSQQSVDHLDLPPVTHNEVYITIPPKAEKAYLSLKEHLVAQIDEETRSASSAAIATSKMSQLAAGFLYPDREDGEIVDEQELIHFHDLKTEAVTEIIENTGSPVLVFYRFIEEKQRLLKAMPQAEFIDAPEAVKRWNQGEIPVLLAHPASAGHGLNLQDGGHTIVWSSPTWSSEEFDQGNARLARQGQKKPVVIHHVLASPVKNLPSIDQAALARVRDKISAQEALKMALKETP